MTAAGSYDPARDKLEVILVIELFLDLWLTRSSKFEKKKIIGCSYDRG